MPKFQKQKNYPLHNKTFEEKVAGTHKKLN